MGASRVTEALRGRGEFVQQSPLVRGTVAGAVGPVLSGTTRSKTSVPTGFPTLTTEENLLWVTSPRYSTGALIGPCEWTAEHGTTLPAQGAACLVAFDSQNRPTVVWWEGAQSAAPITEYAAWKAFTPASVANWSGATAEGRSQQLGKTLNVWIKVTSTSGAPSGSVTVSLPSGVTGFTGITQNLATFGTFGGVTYAGVGTVASGAGVAAPYITGAVTGVTANFPLNELKPASWASSSVVLQGVLNVN